MTTPLLRVGRCSLLVLVLSLVVGIGTVGTVVVVGGGPAQTRPAQTRPAQTRPAQPPAGWTALALGDSVATGAGCDCLPYPERYASLVAARTGVPTTMVNRARNGLTSVALRDRVEHDTALASEVGRSDIITLTIGANDLGPALRQWREQGCARCFAGPASRAGREVGRVLDRVMALRAGRATEVLVTTYWNVFQDGRAATASEPGYRSMSRDATQQLNRELCAAARAHGAVCIGLDSAFTSAAGPDPTPLLDNDADHPSPRGHEVIAAALAAHGWDELSRRPPLR